MVDKPAWAKVSKQKAHHLQARLGVSVNYQNAWTGPNGKMRRNTVYGILNYINDLSAKSNVDVSGTSISRKGDRQWLGMGLGATYNWDDDKFSIYGEVAARTTLAHFGKSYGFRGILGMRVRW